MAVVFHIATRAEWQLGLAAGAYRTGSLDAEGFIHCSTAAQVTRTANRFFAGRTDLVLLAIDGEHLGAALRFEPAIDLPSELFPHVFSPIEISAVFDVITFEPSASTESSDGRFAVPHEVAAFAAIGDWTIERAETEALVTMADFGAPWWVAGGWALELHALAHGQRLRPHGDLEISILRRDQRALFDHLAGRAGHSRWQLCVVAGPGVLESWSGEPLAAGVHQLWARRGEPLPLDPDRFAADPSRVELFLEDADAGSWRYRREPAIARPLDELGAVSARGVPYLRPEIVLLYKAKHLRFKDQRDAAASLPTLGTQAYEWLARALDQSQPDHPWIKHGPTSHPPTRTST